METRETTHLVERVREDAHYVTSHASHVRINSSAIAHFVDDFDFDKAKGIEGMRFPLSFLDVEEEANFWGLLDMLNFGSGFRLLLHASHQQGAFDTIVRGMLSLYISGNKLDASYLTKIGPMDIAANFGFHLEADKPLHEGLSYISAPTELMPLGKFIQKALNDTGRILLEQSCPAGLGQWIMRTLTPSKIGTEQEVTAISASAFIDKLVATFPAFQDKSSYQGREVYILKKAQLLVADLYRLLAPKDARFRFTDIARLTVFADNVLPAVLRKYGILEIDSALLEQIDNKKDLAQGPQEIELRCVAIEACEEILKALRSKDATVNADLLDRFLWTQGKAEGFRTVERHYTKTTWYY